MNKFTQFILRLLKSNFTLWLVRKWLLLRAIDNAAPGQTVKAIREQLYTNKGLKQAKKEQENYAKNQMGSHPTKQPQPNTNRPGQH